MPKPTISIFTGSKGLGTIFSENNSINVKFTEGQIPLTSTAGNFAVNWKGKTRIMMIQAAHDGDGFDGTTTEQKIADFIYEMEEWVNEAPMQTHKVYTDSFGVSYNAYCVDFTWTRSFQQPNRILYTLLLKQA